MNPDRFPHFHPTPSRRHFLKTTAGTAAGAALATGASEAVAAGISPGSTVKVGLVGCGGRGTGAAAQALAADDNIELVAMGDVFEGQINSSLGSLKDAAGKLKVADDKRFVGLDAYQKVIDSGIDLVILASPPGFRPQHLKAAVEAGKHIFCEKPMAVDAPGLRSVLESVRISKEKKIALVAGFCWRYSDSRIAAFSQLHGGAIGDIRGYLATYHTGPVKPHPGDDARPAGMSDVEWQIRNWYNYAWLSGDGLVEQAIHSVDKIGWALGDSNPVAAVATGGRQKKAKAGNIFDHFHIAYEFPGDLFCHLASRQTPGCHNENNDYIQGEKGTLIIGRGASPYIDAKEPWRFRGKEGNMYQNEHDALLASIRKGEPINDGDRMAHSTMLGIMGLLSAYTGQRITWQQAMESELDLAPDDLEWGDSFDPGPLPVPGETKFS